MSEQFSWNLVLPLVGVVIGFLLSQASESWKDRKRKNNVKKALLNELEIIRVTLLDSQKTNSIPLARFPFITETYDSAKIDLASILKPDQLADVQRAYQEIRKLNSPIDQSSRGYFQAGNSTDYSYTDNNIKEVLEFVKKAIRKP